MTKFNTDSIVQKYDSCMDTTESTWQKPMELFNQKDVVKICAPMVRYSKLAFRNLVRRYDCDLAFTPMIIANSFVHSAKARDSELTTNKEDRPLIVQFAANNGKDLADASEIVSPFADGVDLNCGCPQRWAMQEGYGACLINKPELLTDLVKHVRNRISDQDFTVSIKIRIHNDLRKTISLCQQVEKTGVSWISVHGRTKQQKCEPVNYEAIKLVRENVAIPVIANGDIRSLRDVQRVHEETGVKGVMSARGILQNPAMYAGYDATPLQCVRDWIDISLSVGTPFNIFHHHLLDMLDASFTKAEKRVFNTYTSVSAVLDYLDDNYGV